MVPQGPNKLTTKYWKIYISYHNNTCTQRAKKVVSDSSGLVDFAIGLVNFVLNLPDGQVMYFEEFNLQKNSEVNSAHKKIWGASWNDVWASKC